MGWECHWVWRNVCFSYRHFTCPVTACPPRARLIFGKAATRTGPLCGGFALGRCCPVLVAALPLWEVRDSPVPDVSSCGTHGYGYQGTAPAHGLGHLPRRGGVLRGS